MRFSLFSGGTSKSSNAELQDLDLIFTKVSQLAIYPIFLNTLTAALSWGAGGALIFMGNILVATPGNISHNQFNILISQNTHKTLGHTNTH